MAQSAKKITYTIKAEYDGQSDLKKLTNDLKALNQIEVLQNAEKDFMDLNARMVEAKNKVRELRTAMKAPGGAAFAESYKKAKDEVKKLNTALGKQKTKLDDTRSSLQQQGVEIGKATAKYNEMQAAAEQSARVIAARQKIGVRSFREMQQEIDGLKRAYKEMEASGEHSLEELAAAEKKMQTRVEKLNAAMGKTPAVVQKNSNAFRRMSGPLSTASSKLTAFVTAYAGLATVMAAGYGLSRVVTDVVRGSRELQNFANIAGTSVSEFSAAAYATKTVGIEADKLADISKEVKVKIGDFLETGGGEFADFFENVATKVDLSAEALLRMSGPDALIAIKKALDEANVPLEKQIFYFDSLANDADRLIPLLADEGKKMKELAAHAKEMGIAISDLDQAQLLELAGVLDDLKTNIGIINRQITVALAPTIKDMAEYFEENKEQIRETIVAMAEGVAAIGRFVVENHEMIAVVGKIIIALSALNLGLGLFNNTILKPASGIAYLIDKLGALGAGMGTVAKASRLLSVVLRGALPVAAAAGVVSIGAAVVEFKKMRDAQDEAAAAADRLAVTQRKAADKLALVKEQTGLSYESMRDLARAVRDGEVHLDHATGTWKKGAGQMAQSAKEVADATKESFNTQAKYSKEKLISMAQAYKEFADKAKGYADDIANREQSLAEQLREMARSGMSDLGAWKDRKAEADEYAKAARAAVQAGNYDEAIAMADKAKAAYADLNEEVKEGDNVAISQGQALKTAMTGVEQAGQIAIDALEKQKQAAEEAAKTMDDKTGGQLSALADKADEFNGSWDDAWKAMQKQAGKAIDEVDEKLDDMAEDRHVNVYVKEVTEKSTGGYIGVVKKALGGQIGPLRAMAMASGGRYPSATAGYHFSGYGGGDQPKNLVMAEDGEVMIKKESVRSAGLRAALAFNAGRFDIVVRELSKRLDSGVLRRHLGGPIGFDFNPPVLMPQMMASGGQVAAAGGATYNLTVNVSGGASQSNANELARQVMTALKRMHAGASS